MKSDTKEIFTGDAPTSGISTTRFTGLPAKRKNTFGRIIIGSSGRTEETYLFNNKNLKI